MWEEVSLIFILLFNNSPHSPYKKVGYFFARKEYQSNYGNVSRTHIMIEVCWALLTIVRKISVEDFTGASMCDIIREYEIDTFVEEKMIFRKEDIHDVINDAQSFPSHICNNRCLVCGPNGKLRCRMPEFF